MKDLITEQRWVIRYDQCGIGIEPVENSCRDYDCCGGETCGFSLEEAQARVVAHHQDAADFWRQLSPEAFLSAQGYL